MRVLLEESVAELLAGHDAFFFNEHLGLLHEVLLELDGLANAVIYNGLVALHEHLESLVEAGSLVILLK